MSLLAGLALAAIVIGSGAYRSLSQPSSSPPERLTYQGFLVDGNGVALGNTAPKNYDVVFRIYDDETKGGASLLWTEQQTVTVDKGYFSVLLGEGAPVGNADRPDLSTLFQGPTASDRYVGITVKGIGSSGSPDVAILPRLRLLASPYAFLARNAVKLVQDTGADLITSSGNAVTVQGPVTADSFSGNGANLTSLSAGNISSGKLADNRLSSNVALRNGGNTFNGNQFLLGTVGIGTDVPDRTLHVNGTVGVSLNNALEFGRGYTKQEKAGQIGYGTQSGGASGSLDIVGAGTTSKNRKISMWAEGGLNLNGFITNGLTVADGRPQTEFTLPTLTVDTAYGRTFQVTENYIAVSHSSDKAKEFGMYRADSALVLWLRGPNSAGNADRRMSFDGDNNWDYGSDRRLKRDIEDAEPMLERALKVQLRRYRWKDDAPTSKHMLGVIAQELQPLFPDMVGEIEPPGGGEKTLTVGYSDFGMVALKALQELKVKQDAEIADLRKEMAEMRTQMAELLRLNGQLLEQAGGAANPTAAAK